MFPKQDVRGAVKHLKRGGLLWYAPDQDPSRGDSVYVPFFGQPAHSLTSTHQLARMSGAAVVLFQHARRADGGYSLKLQPALDDFPSKDATADTARVMAGIEAMARAARSEEHTSELQSLMRTSYAVFCCKKKKTHTQESSEIKK